MALITSFLPRPGSRRARQLLVTSFVPSARDVAVPACTCKLGRSCAVELSATTPPGRHPMFTLTRPGEFRDTTFK